MKDDTAPIVVWFRRDLRSIDHPALHAACATGRPVIPIFIYDDLADALGAAPKWRLGLGVEAFSKSLAENGSKLVLRKGPALEAIQQILRETGARSVYWSRLYDPDSVSRDTFLKSELKKAGIDARSFGGHLLFEPWTVATKTGGFYKVYTPFWKSVRTRDVAFPLARPSKIPAPDRWPASENIADWATDRGMDRGAPVVRPYLRLGEAAARDRLAHFIENLVAGYDDGRNRPDLDATSGLSENLSLGEISPHICWHAGLIAMQQGKPGAETFLKELVWREFAYHLMHHTPHILTGNWKPEWDAFPWNTDDTRPDVQAWIRGKTGIQFVDAAMREMYVTGRMHNRGRMIVASYLTKHLLSHWQIGQRWFEHCLVDWDPASNAMGWQWSAGSGPDATPFFRVFNPGTQLDKFDPQRSYVRHWLAEGLARPSEAGLSYFAAIPRSWRMSPTDDYPKPVMAAEEGRRRALSAYQNRDFQRK